MTINEAARALLDARAAERAANKARINAEIELLTQLGCPAEGSKTHKTDEYAIEISQPISRSLDDEAYTAIESQIPEELRPVTRVTVLKLDTKGVRYIQDREPAVWKLLSKAITEKPGKPAVSVTALE